MSGFRPALWPTLLTLPALAVLLALGTWQLQRLEWKEALIAARQAQLAAPPAPLQRVLMHPEGLALRRVTASGRLLHDRELHLLAPSSGGEAGYHVLTPLAVAGGDSVVLVDRGWVPPERKDPASRAQGQLAGTVRVEGLARPGGSQGLFVPDNDAAGNIWYWRDLAGMAAHLGLALAPVLIEAGPAPNLGGLPVGGQSRIELPNDHLGYAVTWYALAAALAAVYVLSQRRRGRGEAP